LRHARISAALSQAEVGRACGMSHAAVGRIERGVTTRVNLITWATLLAVVGLDLSARAYPHGTAHRDSVHAALLETLHERLPTGALWATEVPLPNPGDLRSWDAITRVGRLRIGIEAETRARDGQELQRRLALKRRDGAVDRLILLLADTRSNRAFMREFARGLTADFPVSGRYALAALARGADPGDAVILLPIRRVGGPGW
jgi:transcriptional regulator with XRE-family HTH domain